MRLIVGVLLSCWKHSRVSWSCIKLFLVKICSTYTERREKVIVLWSDWLMA